MERRTRRPEKAPENNTSEEEKDERREAAQNAAQRKMRLLIIGLFVCIVMLTIVLCALLLARRGNPQTVQPPAESTQAPLAYDVTAPFGALGPHAGADAACSTGGFLQARRRPRPVLVAYLSAIRWTRCSRACPFITVRT